MQQDSALIDSSHALTRRTRADACAEIAIRACGGPTKSSGQRVLREAPKWSVRICMHCNCRRGGIVYDFAQPITRTALFAFADGRDKERATFFCDRFVLCARTIIIIRQLPPRPYYCFCL